MTAHKHAALMALYAQDAQETERPWELWEFSTTMSGIWQTCDMSPRWVIEHSYRRKPRTIRIGEYDVPEPVRDAPKYGRQYWAVSLLFGYPAEQQYWHNREVDFFWLQRGLIHLTREAAELHARALLSLMEVK